MRADMVQIKDMNIVVPEDSTLSMNGTFWTFADVIRLRIPI